MKCGNKNCMTSKRRPALCSCSICCPTLGESGSSVSGKGCQSTVSCGCRLLKSSANWGSTSLCSSNHSDQVSTWTVRGELAFVGACSCGPGSAGVAGPDVSSGVVLGGRRSHAAARRLPRAVAALRRKRRRVILITAASLHRPVPYAWVPADAALLTSLRQSAPGRSPAGRAGVGGRDGPRDLL